MEEAFLILNTGMHTARVNAVSTDNAGKYVLTCGNDKVARLWDSESGRLLQTYRPPIGENNTGLLFACDVSPNGREVAIGGWTEINNDFRIYLFDASTGKVNKVITGLPNVIMSLKYSPSGRYLATTLGGSNGIRIYRRGTYREVFHDKDYNGRSEDLAFSSSGKLVVVCDDGHVRLYDNDFTLLEKKLTTDGKVPYSISFSPDDQHLALGFTDSSQVQILDADSLEVVMKPDIEGAEEVKNRLIQLIYSQDGELLIGGGMFSKYGPDGWRQHLRVWEEGGKGSHEDYSVSFDSITDLCLLPEDRLLYVSTGPDWGMFDLRERKNLIYVGSGTLDYRRRDRGHLRVSREGFEIGIRPIGRPARYFDIGTRELIEGESHMPSYKDQRGPLKIENWLDEYHPTLNGKPLSFLKKYEKSHSVDIATDKKRIVFGTNYGLYLLDAEGKEIWSVSTQASATAVKISGSRELVIATLSSGQIRWYRMNDGTHLLSLFLHPDEKRWVLWTPSGYYDASAGAEELIGWHVNQGENKEGIFYPISHFREQYYRPDVIDIILEEMDEEKALDRANATNNRPAVKRTILEKLPPNVRILSPAKGAQVDRKKIQLKYQLESPDGSPIETIKILVDGRPVGNPQRGMWASGSTEKTTIEIPDQDCTIAVIAENRHGNSEPASTYLTWKGSAQQDVPKPTLYLLAIGVGAYDHLPALRYTAKDAQDFADALLQQQGKMYKKVERRILTDSTATKDDILKGLQWIKNETTSQDLAVLFFAGHGIDDNAGTFFFLPQEAQTDALYLTAVMKETIRSVIASIPGKVLTFMDACHSGGLMKETRRSVGPDISRILNEFASAENGAITYSSCTGRQYALEKSAWKNGAFTKALVEGLKGEAKAADGRVTCKSLDNYVTERVKKLTAGKQAPVTNFPPDTPDFPIAIF